MTDLDKLNFKSRRAGIPADYHLGIMNNPHPTGVSNSVENYLDQPMVAQMEYLFTLGDLAVSATDEVTNAADKAALDYYTLLRSNNVSISSFTKSDVFKVAIAVAELYAYHEELCRDFKFLFKRKMVNAAFSDLLRHAAGVDVASVEADMSNIATRLNKAAIDLHSIPMLKGIPVFDDMMDISSKLYADDDIEKSGIIIYSKSQILKYDTMSTSPTVGNLVYTAVAGNFVAKVSQLETMIRAILNDQDVSNIGSEILKAVGSGSLEAYNLTKFNLDKLEESANDLKPEFNYVLFDRIQNSTVYPIQTTSPTTEVNGIAENSKGEFAYRINTGTNLGQGMMYADTFDGTGTYSNQFYRPDIHSSFLFSHDDDPSGEVVAQYIFNHEHIAAATDASPRIIYGLSLFHAEYIRVWYYMGSAGNSITWMRITTLPHKNSSLNFRFDLSQPDGNTMIQIQSVLTNYQKYSSFACLPNVLVPIINDDTSYNGLQRYFMFVRDIDNFADIPTKILQTNKILLNEAALAIQFNEKVDKATDRPKGNNSKGKK